MLSTRTLKRILILWLAIGILSLVWLALMPMDANRGHIFNYKLLRLLLGGGTALILIGLFAFYQRFIRDEDLAQNLCAHWEQALTAHSQTLAQTRFWLIIAFIFSVECYLLSYLAIPVPARPLIAWMAFIFLSTIITLTLTYRDYFRARPRLIWHIKTHWRSWQPVQQRTLLALALLGLIYFCLFIPINASGPIHPDEDVIYPDVVNMLIGGETFSKTLSDSFIISSWWYGYPYFPISAIPLIIPRIIFGEAFAQNVNLNLLLMRQFVSVFPMVLSLIFMVYIVDGFKHFWASIGMFITLALVPAVVQYNIRFWHPDSIILFLVLLAIFLLERDKLRFGSNFYWAAAVIGFNAVIKVWGLFFFLAIAGYLLAGWITKKLTFTRMLRAGILFILVMLLAIIITSPSILIPWNLKTYIAELKEYYPVMREGYDEPDPEGVYRLGLDAWLPFIRRLFMQDFYFWFALAALGLGSLLGRKKMLYRLLLSWCLVAGGFLVLFIAVKSFQYILVVLMPMYMGVFLLPHIAGGEHYPKWCAFLSKPIAVKVLTLLVSALTLINTYFNVHLLPKL